MTRTVLGIDGGLAHLGWAIARVDDGVRPTVVEGGVVETAKRSEGTAAESHLARAVEVYDELMEIADRHLLTHVCAEAFSAPRDARSAAMLAWSWGVITSVACSMGLAIDAKGPMPLKRALTGSQTATKEDVIAAVRAAYPETEALFGGLRRDLHEHLADAVAAIHFFHGARAEA